jgi:hypothetical protein
VVAGAERRDQDQAGERRASARGCCGERWGENERKHQGSTFLPDEFRVTQ